ncbi:MAG: SRPBCC domain-containing protein [Gemmatimonadaceae bacterium]|nr:SRPBCC domain-containing protein [Gemmatimonadaceae bacterium]
MTTAFEAANEIRITRIYDAPVAMVWEAWTDVTQVGHWWGPRGFTITTHAKELRPGGFWEYTMHGPDGKDWPNYTRYHVVEPRARLEYDHGASSADAAPMFRVVATFRDVGGKTELDMRMILPTAEAAAQTRTFVKAAGGNGTWDRLAEYLEHRVSSREVFVINRSFSAPVDRVFAAWTTPDQLAAWMPPTGMSMHVKEADIRAGGRNVFSMSNDAFTMYGRIDYETVEPPSRLVYQQRFTDADGNTSRHPGAPVWPEVMHVTVTFVAEGAARTRVTVLWQPHGEPTAAEVAAFVTERAGMTQGWSGSFDKLDGVLAG